MTDIALGAADRLPDEKELQLADYLAIIRRRSRVIVASVLVVFAISASFALFWPAKYLSSSTILIEQQEIPQELVRSTITSFADQRVQIISQQIMTTANLLGIIRKYDLYPRMMQTRAREVVLQEMRDDTSMDMISAEVVDPRSGRPTEATIAFNLSYKAPTPDLAVKVANELTTLFLSKNLETRAQMASDTANFLSAEASFLREEIADLESRLSTFKADNAGRLPELSEVNLTRLDRSERELLEIDRQLRSLAETTIYLEAELLKLTRAENVFSGTGERIYSPGDRLKYLNTELASLQALYSDDHPDVLRTRREIAGLRKRSDDRAESRELQGLHTDRAGLLELYTDDHPAVKDVERRIRALEAEESDAAAEDLADDPAVAQLSAQLAAAKAEESSLIELREEVRSRMLRFEENLSQTPVIEKDYYALTRDLDNARLKYREIRAREMEARLSESMESDRKGERFTMIEPPLPPEKPASPNRALILGFGAFLGLGVAFLAAAIAEGLDNTVRGRRTLEELTGIQVLGVIPTISTSKEDLLRRRLRRLGAFAAIAVCVLAVVLVHILFMPLDVLWYSLMRRLAL